MSLQALLTTAAFAPIENLGWLRITGEDRVRWLNGMTTNNIAALTPGQGCYTFFLNAQGRILADATAWVLEDSILLETANPTVLTTLLDRFIIMDDVELTPVDDLTGILIAGPQALSIVAALGTPNHQAAPCTSEPQVPATQSLHLKQTTYAGAPVSLIQAHSPLVPQYEIWSDPSTIAAILDELRGTQHPPSSPADLEQLRILSGTPLYGTDIRNTEAKKDLPQETAQTRALHFSKGCYLGQEIVERIHSRGAVHRTFTGFFLTPDFATGLPDLDGMIVNAGAPAPPVPGTPLFASDAPEKTIGELTSVAQTPFGLVALGYIRRDALDQNKSIQYPGGTATPSALPFAIPDTKRA